MPTTAEENKRITAHRVRPARASAVASNGANIPSVVDILDVSGEFPSVNAVAGNTANAVINHRRCDYVLTTAPDNTIIPNPQVGDRAFVFLVDGSAAGRANPYSYQEFHYTRNAAGTALVWRQVAYV
jgi:hypothetical protein